jgi:LysR family transcriptional regulator, hydrogen peroxide-inducible genes activator
MAWADADPRDCSAHRSQPHNVRIISFADPEPSREIGLIWRKQSERRDDFEALAATIVDCSRRLMISADDLDELAA